MQTLTRDGWSAEQITSLLTSDVMYIVSSGCELLAGDLSVVDDISSDLLSGSITHVVDADGQHGTIAIQLSRELAWGIALIRPYMVLSNGDVTARFNCGVFALTTPERLIGSPIPTFDVQGYDRLYLLCRSVGDAYSITGGTLVLQAVRDTIAAAGLTGVLLDGTAQDKTLPTNMVWPLLRAQRDERGRFLPGHDTDYAWLDIVNDLLAVIGYRRLWVDENGFFRSEPDVDPLVRAVEFAFDFDDVKVIVGPNRTLVHDSWQVPNRWVFVQQNRASEAPAPTEGDGVYTVPPPGAPHLPDQLGRDLDWPSVVHLDAADQATLVAQGDARVAADRRVATTLKVTTAPFPVVGHGDVYTYTDTALGSTVKVTSLMWTLDLLGADMTHEWSVIQ
ncbi:MAG: hypothetical protein JWM93_2034 [Frankiales bacterium]|nr:hypothetical protein [Frankiales bacterium]